MTNPNIRTGFACFALILVEIWVHYYLGQVTTIDTPMLTGSAVLLSALLLGLGLYYFSEQPMEKQ